MRRRFGNMLEMLFYANTLNRFELLTWELGTYVCGLHTPPAPLLLFLLIQLSSSFSFSFFFLSKPQNFFPKLFYFGCKSFFFIFWNLYLSNIFSWKFSSLFIFPWKVFVRKSRQILKKQSEEGEPRPRVPTVNRKNLHCSSKPWQPTGYSMRTLWGPGPRGMTCN